MAIGEPSPQSGRRQVPSLGQVESSTGTRPRNYNLQSSATSLTCTQRWNWSPVNITKRKKINRSGSSKPKRHRQEVPKVKVREDVEEGEEGEGVSGVYPDDQHHRAGEPRGDAAEQPCRQKTKKEIENHKNTCRRYPCRISSH